MMELISMVMEVDSIITELNSMVTELNSIIVELISAATLIMLQAYQMQENTQTLERGILALMEAASFFRLL